MSWLEEAVAEGLTRVLGAYFSGIDKERLGVSIWNGDIRLRHLKVKTGALEELLPDLPLRLAGGTLGEVCIKVPWRNLGKAPMLMTLDRLFLLFAPKDADAIDEQEETERTARSKREQLEAWEAVATRGTQAGQKWEDRLTASLLQKLEVVATNVHVRLETPAEEGSAGASLGIVLPSLRVADLPPEGGVLSGGRRLMTVCAWLLHSASMARFQGLGRRARRATMTSGASSPKWA